MNYIMEFSPPPDGDTRCAKCKYHRYVILSISNALDIEALHTRIDITPIGKNQFPEITTSQALHWWGTDTLSRLLVPQCLKSYRRIR